MTEPQQLTLCEILPPEAKESKRWPGIWVTPDGQHVYKFTRRSRNSQYRWHELTRTAFTSHGYRQVGFSVNGKMLYPRVHHLVMDAFGEPKPSDAHEIRHLNGNRRDNRIENLAWGTRRENWQDSVRHGTAVFCTPKMHTLRREGWRKRKERLEAAKIQER